MWMRQPTLTAACVLAAVLAQLTAARAQQEPAETDAVTSIFSEERILRDLSTDSLTGEDIRQISDVPRVQVIGLEGISGEFRLDVMRILQNTEDNFAEVRTAIQANPGVHHQVRQAGVEISEIAAATRDNSGVLTVYVNPPQFIEQVPEGEAAEIE
jgi:hypothetical protein